MGLQRVGHDLTAKQRQQQHSSLCFPKERSLSTGSVAGWLQEAEASPLGKGKSKMTLNSLSGFGGQSEGKGMGGCKAVFEEQVFH